MYAICIKFKNTHLAEHVAFDHRSYGSAEHDQNQASTVGSIIFYAVDSDGFAHFSPNGGKYDAINVAQPRFKNCIYVVYVLDVDE